MQAVINGPPSMFTLPVGNRMQAFWRQAYFPEPRWITAINGRHHNCFIDMMTVSERTFDLWCLSLSACRLIE